MTKAELLEKLADYPNDMQVFIYSYNEPSPLLYIEHKQSISYSEWDNDALKYKHLNAPGILLW